jgi:hypothetical protein
MKRAVVLASLLLIMIFSLPAHSAEKAGVVMLDTQMVGSTQLWINGIALREKFVFDVYVAALYLEKKSSDADAVLAKDAPRMMVMHFLRSIGANKINSAWYEGLTNNVSHVTQELSGKFDRLSEMMDDVTEGQTMRFTYDPASGTEINVNGTVKGTIPGKDFADAILATWIGPRPGPGKKFKTDLLGQ